MILNRPSEVVTPTVDGDVMPLLARGDAAFIPHQVRELACRHSIVEVSDVVRTNRCRYYSNGSARGDRPHRRARGTVDRELVRRVA